MTLAPIIGLSRNVNIALKMLAYLSSFTNKRIRLLLMSKAVAN